MSYRLICAVAALLFGVSLGANADASFPDRPIRLVVPYPAGGLLDNVARTLAPGLRDALGQPVVIDNRGGAGGAIGAEIVAKAAPDGYTLLFGGFGPNAVSASIFPSIPYDPETDFSPVVEVFRTANVLVVGKQVEAVDVAQLTELGRRSKLAVATAGAGSATHLFAELYRLAMGIDLNVVPYRGDAPAITALLGGEVQAYFASAITILPHVKSGRLRALAVTSRERITALPEVPTLAEAGVPNYEATAWYGIYVPAGTPGAVVDRLNREINRVLQQPKVREALLGSGGVDIVGGAPEALRTQTDSEITRWRKVVESANLKAQ